MKIRELMSRAVHCCRPQDSLDAVAHKMWQHDCGGIPVLDAKGRVGAMITDRDLCMAAWTTGRPLHELRVADAMSRDIVTCHRDEELGVALHHMARRQLHRLPVVDGDGRLTGILTLNDLLLAGGSRRSKLVRGVLEALAAVGRPRASLPAVSMPAPPVVERGVPARGGRSADA